jgi:hypothetical protein
MWKIFLSELEYHIKLLGIVLLLISAFTLSAIFNFQVFTTLEFLRKYFWAIFVGLGTYLLVYLIWMQRTKEIREQLMFKLPVSAAKIAILRWIFAAVPFLFVMIFIQILQLFLNEEWNIQIGRISGQLGFLAIFLSILFISRDLLFVIKNSVHRTIIMLLGSVLGVFGIVAIIKFASYELAFPLYIHWEELLFFLWGIFISLGSIFTYQIRKSYLA